MKPTELLATLVAMFPEFATVWADPGNLNVEEDGAYTLGGVFIEFSWFFRDRYESLPRDRVRQVAELLNDWVGGQDDCLREAAVTFFLDNVFGERCSPDFRKYLRGESIRIWSMWEDAAGR